MALLQDQEVRLKRQLEKKQARHGTKATQIATGFLFGTVVVCGILILLIIYAVSPDGFFFGKRSSDYDARLTNQLVGLIHQGAETVLPTDATVEAIRKQLQSGDFAILTTPDLKSTRNNTTIDYDLRIIRGEGFSEPVSLSAINLPGSLVAASTPQIVGGKEEKASIQITVPADVPVGSYNFTILAKAETKEKSANAALSVSNFAINNAELLEVAPMPTGIKWQASIGWGTDVPANTWVEYAPEDYFIQNGQAYAFTSSEQSNTKDHAITLTYLEPNTVYHYRIRSVDELSNIVVGNDRAFITQSAQ